MKYPKLFLALSLFCFCYGCLYAQTPSDVITSKLKTYTSKHISEKVYLQFDKPFYAAGDTIYFKAYVTMGERHNLSLLSGVLHAELINTTNKIDRSVKLQLVNGVTWGDFGLPDSLPSGNYRVRAYTTWMRNEGEDAYFEKIIPVGNPLRQKVPESSTARAVQAKADLQLFPEGGELVTGVSSKIAFKAIGTNGMGIGVKGAIVDNTGKEIAEIQSTHLGMGYFNLLPEPGRSYTAQVTYADGSKDEVPLPPIAGQGISLAVNNDSLPKAAVKIEANKAYYEANKGKDYTVLIWSGSYATTVSCKLDSPVITMDIIKRRLFTGVTRITLFSGKSEPLCERLIFVQNFDQLSLGINADKASYKTRDKVAIKLNARTRADSSAIGHFSVSVTDEGKVHQDENDESTILTNLLLTSDLKGYIEHPNYYFAGIDEEKLKKLDLVMLTHGYRHFTWKQALDSADYAAKYPVEGGISIRGFAENLFGKPIARAVVTLISVENRGFTSDTTDDKGHFHFDNIVFTDTARFVLQAINAKGKNTTKLTYDKEAFPTPKVLPAPKFNFTPDTAMGAYLKNAEKEQEIVKAEFPKAKALKEVKIVDYRSSSLTGPGHADQVLHAADIENMGGMLSDRLNGRLNGVNILNGVPYFFGHRMAIFFDNIQINSLNQVNAEDIETVEVLRFTSASIYGIQGGNGVVVLTSKVGRSMSLGSIASMGVLPITVRGFYKARQFYSPKYDASLPPNPRPDLRSTIYWNPAVVTDKDGNASFDFFSADAPGSYRVVLEGMDSKGNIGRKVVYLHVQ